MMANGIGHKLAAWRDDVAAAAMFLTRLPVGWTGARPQTDLARAGGAFALVGILVGLAGAGAYELAGDAGLTTLPSALLAVTATIVITGALHEDGLADTADGFGGGRTRARKLEIMRDSRNGTFGVLALVLSVGLRASAIAAIGPSSDVLMALVAAHALSRGTLPFLMRWLGPARPDGLGAGAGRPRDGAVATALLSGIAVVFLALPLEDALAGLFCAAAALVVLAMIARRQIGGYTGDVLGAAQQIGEITMLLSVAAS